MGDNFLQLGKAEIQWKTPTVGVGLLKATEGREVELFLSFHLNESKESSVGVIMEGSEEIKGGSGSIWNETCPWCWNGAGNAKGSKVLAGKRNYNGEKLGGWTQEGDSRISNQNLEWQQAKPHLQQIDPADLSGLGWCIITSAAPLSKTPKWVPLACYWDLSVQISTIKVERIISKAVQWMANGITQIKGCHW